MSRHIYGHSILELVIEAAGAVFFGVDKFIADRRRR